MAEVISFCWIAMELVSEFLFCECFLQRRKWNYITYIAISLTLIFVFLYSNSSNKIVPSAYITPLFYFVLFFFCYKGLWQRRILSVIMCSLLLIIVDALIMYVWSAIFHISIEEIRERKYTYFSVGTICKSTSLLLAWLFYRSISRSHKEQLRIRWLFLTLLFPAISYFTLIIIYREYRFEGDLTTRALGITLIIAIANIATMYTINQLEKSEKNSQRVALLNQQMDIQTESILGLEKSYRSQRAVSHEFTHHLNTISALLEKQQYVAAEQYVHKLQEQQTTRVFVVNSHHPVVDAVLNQKYQTAKEQGVDMQITVSDLSELSLPTEMLVVILSNLLDNAIEASSQYAGEKVVQFSMILTDKLTLSIRNSTKPVQIVNGTPITTKLDKDNHGYGLQNVERLLDGLAAEHAWSYQDNWFSFVAEIPAA